MKIPVACSHGSVSRLSRRAMASFAVTFLLRLILSFSALAFVLQARGQVGNDNPTGSTGIFNGNITTGCSYDPYTANAMRRVTDITVAGAIGTYGLSFSRISNSRGPFGGTYGSGFGMPGAWAHSYAWTIAGSLETTGTAPPTSYDVSFADGRYEIFQHSSTLNDGYYHAGQGVAERFQPLNTSTLLAYLILADGGKVEFKGTLNSEWDPDIRKWYYWWTFVAQAIIDPYGLRTTFSYDSNGWLTKITEPAGRYITVNWGTLFGSTVITSIQGSDGRTVQYYYAQQTSNGVTFTLLDHVVYFPGAADSVTARYRYSAPNANYWNVPLLWTCDDPMYAGPMKRIAYIYQTTNNPDGSSPVYGQVKSENYYDGTNVGAAVSTLTVNNSTTRTETRADGKTRTFTYSDPYRTIWTDFKGASASQTYDANKYIASVTDRNGHKTTMTRNALTGAVTSVTSPVASDVVPSSTSGTVTYTYGSSTCADPNNQDANNPYYVCTATDEGGHVTKFTRDANKRVTRIDYPYPDGGYEAFTYDANHFYQLSSHRMATGGTESFTYNGPAGLKDTYRNPSNAGGNPTARYSYDNLYRISGITDALGASPTDVLHTTNFAYNARGQLTLTTHPTDPVDGQRHTITNVYNSDGTLKSTTDELNHTTSYTYDDYRRRRSMTTPTSHVTNYFYDAGGTGDDYRYTDAGVTYVTLPSGKRTHPTYDENRRKSSVTVAVGTSDVAVTSYGYDNVGNVTSAVAPNEQAGQLYAGKSTVTAYDERNRPKSVTDALGNVTSFKYDTAGRKASVTRPNLQVTTYDSYDAMNRLLQQTATQTPDPSAVTKYTYYTSGLLHTMQDPHLVALGTGYNYSYAYDSTGRKTSLTYPPDPANGNVQRSDLWTYDTAGRIGTFTNRSGEVQTFTYDALNRATGFSWNVSGLSVTFGYDVASRLTTVNNANAAISRSYYNDNLLYTETETITGRNADTMTYTYDADGNLALDQWSSYVQNTYTYTGRNQLKTLVVDGSLVATYAYDPDGNLSTRIPNNTTSSTYSYDALDRVTHITHSLVGATRTFDYGYDNVGNRKWTKRDAGTGDVFGYDYNDQVTAVKLNIANPDTTAVGLPTITYDANGNRTQFAPYGTTDNYTTNNLNQYSQRNSTTATYGLKGNLNAGFDGSTYSYDAQSRLTSATKSGTSETFKYDGLNRQVSRTVNGVTTYNVYDGWNLIGEYANSATTPSAGYIYGASGLVKNVIGGNYYYQDGSGSTSHLADSTGHLLEWYRYDLQGTPVFYNFANTQQSASAYGIRHLFTGQQWYSELGLYDLRNRFYSPDIGRFLQPDPSGFNGDPTNLYRYCGNNPLKSSDPTGLSGTLTIYSNYGNAAASSWGGGTGHSWISYVPDSTGIWTTYGTYGNNPGGNPNGLLPNQEGYFADVMRSAWIDDQGESLLNNYIAYMKSLGPDAWQVGFTGPCSTFAAIAWASGTGESLAYRNAGGYGASTPSALANSIKSADRGGNYGYLFPDGSSLYTFGDGGYGVYDNSGSGYYIWDPNGAPGIIVGQDTNGNSIYQGKPVGGQGGVGGSGPGGYGATVGYSPGYSGPAIGLGAPGTQGFGWDAAFSPTEGYSPKKF
jgi:RHS repeat-associated protein